MHQTFMHARTQTHNLWLWPKRPLWLFFCGRNVHGQNVQAETSWNEMSAAEMSYIRMCPPLMNTNGKFIEKWNAGQYD